MRCITVQCINQYVAPRCPPLPPQELGKQNPALLQIINSNQQEFMRLLTEAPTDEEEAAMAEALGGLGEGVSPLLADFLPVFGR